MARNLIDLTTCSKATLKIHLFYTSTSPSLSLQVLNCTLILSQKKLCTPYVLMYASRYVPNGHVSVCPTHLGMSQMDTSRYVLHISVCPKWTRLGMSYTSRYDLNGHVSVCPTRLGMTYTSRYVLHISVCPKWTRLGMSETSRYDLNGHVSVCPTRLDMTYMSRYDLHVSV